MIEQTSETPYQDFYEHAPCGYVILSDEGTILQGNQTFLSWTRYRWSELQGHRFVELMSIGGRLFYQLHVLPRLHLEASVSEVLCDIVCGDGSLLPVIFNMRAHVMPGSTEKIFLLTIFAIHTRRAYERELQEARKRAQETTVIYERFIALVSHELRTPFTNAMELFQQLGDRMHHLYGINVNDIDIARSIHQQLTTMQTMILALADVSRIEAGQFSVSMSVCDVGTLIHESIARFQEQNRILFTASDQPAMVMGDSQRLIQVFHILIENALKYSLPEESISIGITRHDRSLRISVHDDGYGINIEALPHLFERFYRFSYPYATEQTGLGIGLYLAREIIALHHGAIQVTTGNGTGTTFLVELPLFDA